MYVYMYVSICGWSVDLLSICRSVYLCIYLIYNVSITYYGSDHEQDV